MPQVPRGADRGARRRRRGKGRITWQADRRLPSGTSNNVAEYVALLLALDRVLHVTYNGAAAVYPIAPQDELRCCAVQLLLSQNAAAARGAVTRTTRAREGRAHEEHAAERRRRTAERAGSRLPRRLSLGPHGRRSASARPPPPPPHAASIFSHPRCPAAAPGGAGAPAQPAAVRRAGGGGRRAKRGPRAAVAARRGDGRGCSRHAVYDDACGVCEQEEEDEEEEAEEGGVLDYGR